MPKPASASRVSTMRALLARNTRGEATLRELAEEIGVSVSTLSWWRRRLKADEASPSFVEVTLEKPAVAAEIVLEVSNVRILVPSTFDSTHLRSVVEVLRKC